MSDLTREIDALMRAGLGPMATTTLPVHVPANRNRSTTDRARDIRRWTDEYMQRIAAEADACPDLQGAVEIIADHLHDALADAFGHDPSHPELSTEAAKQLYWEENP